MEKFLTLLWHTEKHVKLSFFAQLSINRATVSASMGGCHDGIVSRFRKTGLPVKLNWTQREPLSFAQSADRYSGCTPGHIDSVSFSQLANHYTVHEILKQEMNIARGSRKKVSKVDVSTNIDGARFSCCPVRSLQNIFSRRYTAMIFRRISESS